jgi:Flp pilus assembly protein TadG
MNMFRKWLSAKDGATAVEFSLLALPLIVMIIGTIEIALMFTTQSLLDASTSTAARLIRTGQIQQSDAANQEQLFRDTLCGFAKILIPCGEIQFQVDDLDNFGDADGAPPPQFDDEGNLQNQGFSTGGENDVVLIRVAYRYSIITPLMQFVLTNRGDGSRIMMSTVVLQTEPYEFTGEDDE